MSRQMCEGVMARQKKFSDWKLLYSFILVSLDNIQDHLEHPFDEIGEDDIRIDEREIIDYMAE